MDRIEDFLLHGDKVCRLCCLKKDSVSPIFNEPGSNLSVIIKEVLPSLNILENDSKPQQICEDCCVKVHLFKDFLQQCLASECRFNSCIEGPVRDNFEAPFLQETTIIIDQAESTRSSFVFQQCEADYNFSSIPLEEEVLKVTQNELSENFIKATSGHAISGPEEEELESEEIETTICSIGNHNLDSDNSEPKKKKWECTLCQKIFSRRTRLNSHMTLHTGLKTHKCTECTKSFATGWSLTLHMKMHNRNIICDLCQRAFPSRNKLERHRMWHTGEKPFQCETCGKKFTNKKNLTRHMDKHNPVSSSLRYYCVFCPRVFKDRSTLKHHFDQIHSDNPPPKFECPHCDKKFKWKTNYNRHINSHSKSPEVKTAKYECPYCQKKFGWKNNCTRHMKSHNIDQDDSFPP